MHILNLRHLSTNPLVSHVMCLSISVFAYVYVCLGDFICEAVKTSESSPNNNEDDYETKKTLFFKFCSQCMHANMPHNLNVFRLLWKRILKKIGMCIRSMQNDWQYPSLLLLLWFVQEKDGNDEKKNAKYSKLMHWWLWHVCVERIYKMQYGK